MYIATTYRSALVMDATHKYQGEAPVQVDADQNGPISINFRGQVYWFSGRSGVHVASGHPVREMLTQHNDRVWLTLYGDYIWEG